VSARARLEAAAVRALAALPEAAQRRIAGAPVEIDGQRLETEVQMLIKLRERDPRPALDTLEVPDARALIEEEAATVRGKVRRMADVRELDAGGLRARLYVPPEELGGLLVYYHGGGHVVGSLDSHDATCRFLAREGRTRVLAVDYRLAPEAKFPAAVEDGLAAYEWAREHAAELDADPERVMVGGDSAGGNIAAVVTQLAERKPAMQMLIYPVCDLSKKHESYRLFGEGFFLTEANMDWYRGHYLPDEGAARDPRASPLLAEDVSGLPKTYIGIAGFDPLRDEALAYARKLELAGVDVDLVLHEGLIHGYANAVGIGRTSPAAMRQACRAITRI
jgi:acetyl esterase